MTSTEKVFDIPSIDGESSLVHPKILSKGKTNNKQIHQLGNEPAKLSGWSLLGKVIIAIGIGALMSVMLFMVMSAVDLLIGVSVSSSGVQIHPLRWVIFLGLGFFVTLIGSLLMTFIYSLIYSEKYHSGSQTAGSLLLIGIFLFIAMLILFAIFKDTAEGPIILFVVYVAFAVFIASSQIEFIANPNYASSALIGNAIGFIFALVIFGILWNKNTQGVDTSAQSMLIWLSTLISFPIIVFIHGLWEIVYHKMYEYGNNPFYIPSRAELSRETLLEQEKEEMENEEINVL